MISRYARACAFVFALTGILTGGCSGKGTPADDSAKLAGQWTAVSVEESGKKLDAKTANLTTVTIENGVYHRVDAIPSKFVSHGQCSVRVDFTKTPKQIDLVKVDGEQAGKTLEGIFELNEGELKLNIASVGEPRPADFTPAKKTSVLVLKKKS